jgi:plastocyanin
MLKGANVSGKSTGASAPPAVLDQRDCMYGPQIFAVQTGQKILVKNSDPTLHNIHLNPALPANTGANPPNNFAQMQGQPDLTISFPAPEVFLKFQCDVHPWMFSWVTVVDHPWFAVTDKDGKYTIKNVPPGKYTITALHRKAGPKEGTDKEIEVKDGEAKQDFTLEIK